MNKLAKALYDNTAECADELAFKKGDIMTVMDQEVAGTSGWWMCSLDGRCGLAPANRLELLPQSVEEPILPHRKSDIMHNIYQIPSVPQSVAVSTNESMQMIYNTPAKSPVQTAVQHSSEGPEGDRLQASFFITASRSKGDVYDVPNQARRPLLIETATPGQVSQKSHLIVELEKKFHVPENFRSSSPGDSCMYAVPSPLLQDPNYDIPVPSATECPQRYTLPNPHKPEWIYDVPAGSDKQSPSQANCDTSLYKSMPSATECPQEVIGPYSSICSPLYDFPLSSTTPVKGTNTASSLYDIPKPGPFDSPSPPTGVPPVSPDVSVLVCAVPPKEKPVSQAVSDTSGDHKPLECRSDPSKMSEFKRVRLQRMRNFLACTTFCDLPGRGESVVQEDNEGKAGSLTANSPRSSTASSSSSSSCDSLALSSSSPEPLQEVTLSQDEACRKLLDLQESVCRAVPQLMEFVSSNWRSKGHLNKHLEKIKEATETIVCSVICFLKFALDIKGNARHLTDVNLQTRLYKQLEIVENCDVILQQTASDLNMAGWTINTLCQDPGQVHTSDQLDRFVMVARTVPEDIKRLVSIIHANSKLLFKTPQKDPESVGTRRSPATKEGPDDSQHGGEPDEDDDYIELMVEDRNEEKIQKEPKVNISPPASKTPKKNSDSSSGPEQQPSSLSEHCRLYFGALQKAIGAFVDSLRTGQPPEKFISQSKLVIMVGQRLVDTLCKEAHRQASSQSLLYKSNHLCALLKQLAVATKKAALHFPEKQTLQEVQEFATELAQRAQHFRISLDL